MQSSSIHGAGEGLFAKKDVEAYTIVSVYSGLTMSKDQYMAEATLSHSKDGSNLATPNAIGLEPNQVTKKTCTKLSVRKKHHKYVFSLIR